MLNYDEILQEKLTDLENGQPLKEVVESLSGEMQELKPLISLAAAIQRVPHPETQPSRMEAQRQQVVTAAQAQPYPRQTSPQPLPPRTLPPIRQRQPAWAGQKTWKWLGGAAALSAAGMFLFMLVTLSVGLGLWLHSTRQNTARAETVLGQVQVATGPQGNTWKNLEPGDRIRQGQRLRTLGASYAALVFSEGSRTFVSANTDLTFAQLDAAAGHGLQVEIIQNSGETWHKVIPLQGKASFFLVRTPSGTASVRGTSFSVRVSQSGLAHFSVDTGAVQITNGDHEVTLLSGQATAARPSGEIGTPAYQLNIQGSLLAMDEINGIWNVSGMDFQVNEATIITVKPQLGDAIKVTGRFLPGIQQVADAIQPASNDEQIAFFTGPLESLDDESGMIGGIAVKMTAQTRLDEDLKTGLPVKVTFNLLADQTWLALAIEALVENPEGSAATPTATADPNAKPSYEFDPDELELNSCENTGVYSLTGVLRNTTDDPKNYAANVRLGYLIDRGGEYVSAVRLDPEGWTRLDAGQTVQFEIQVTMNEAWASAPEGTEVKLRIYITSATNRPDHLNGRLMVTISAGCPPETTPTPDPTPTGVLPPGLTQTPTPEATQTSQCTGADPHPTGEKLAQRYGVTYEEIMHWFCNGHYGFGEIDLAYSLSAQTGKPVEEIFAMRASGMGWGEIKKALLDGGIDNADDKKEKDADKKDKKEKDK